MNIATTQSPTPGPVPPQELQRRLAAGQPADLLDVRSPAEFATAHVPGARLVPLDQLDAAAFARQRPAGAPPLYVLCQSGSRAARAVEQLRRAGLADCAVVEGGTQAWLDAGLPVNRGTSRVLPLMRQVQIIVGAVTAAGAALALAVHPWFAVVPLVTGSGLLFAGATGFCGLALVLARMPWNQAGGCTSGACGTSNSRTCQ